MSHSQFSHHEKCRNFITTRTRVMFTKFWSHTWISRSWIIWINWFEESKWMKGCKWKTCVWMSYDWMCYETEIKSSLLSVDEKFRGKWKRCKLKQLSKAANFAFLRMNSEITRSERRLWGNLVDRTLLHNARGINDGTDDSMNSWWEQFISWQSRPLMLEYVRQKSSNHVWI
jgi:hypothetical protein